MVEVESYILQMQIKKYININVLIARIINSLRNQLKTVIVLLILRYNFIVFFLYILNGIELKIVNPK